MWSKNYWPFQRTWVHAVFLNGIRVAQSFVFCVVFYKSLFGASSLFFWLLCCLSFSFWLLYCLSLFFWLLYYLSLFFWLLYYLSLFFWLLYYLSLFFWLLYYLSLFFWLLYYLSLFFWLLYYLSLFFWLLYCLSLFFWLLYCLSLSDLQILITVCLSATFSYRFILARRGRWCRWKRLALGSIRSSIQLYWLGPQTTGRCRKKWRLFNALCRRALEVVWLIV